MGDEGHCRVWVEAGATLSVRRFSIHEAISWPFEVNLFVRSDDVGIDLESIVSRPASFRIESGGVNELEPERLWTGVCSHIEQLRPEPSKGSEKKGRSTYYMRIAPALWLLTQSRGHRRFRHMSAVDVIKKILKEWEIEPELRLTKGEGYYKKLEYVAQYGESDFDFVSRVLEAAGIAYFFHHDGDSPTKLVLADEPQRGQPRAPLPFRDNPTESDEGEFVTHVRLAHRVKPGSVSIRDYDFRSRPDTPLVGEATPAPAPEEFYEHYTYEPGAFRVKSDKKGEDPVADEKGSWPFRHRLGDGNELARRRLSSLRRGKRLVSFDANSVGLAPGRVFSMDGHPRKKKDLGRDKTLLVTAYSLDAAVEGKWLFSGEAVFTDVPYQPALTTPKPKVAGVESAIVVGKGQEEIYTDEYGRVKVQFHWDREGAFDDQSSCWMHVSQAWAGSAFGAIMLPRVKQEVLVTYFEGDPDMPVVVGRVYDVTRPVPYKLPDHDRKSVWKTKSSPEDPKRQNAYNELRFDDTSGDELVYVQAQRDYQALVKRNETERTGMSRVMVVGENRSAIVAKVDAHLVGKKYAVQVIKEPDAGKKAIEDKTELKLLEQKKPELTPKATKIEMVDEKILCTTEEATLVMKDKDVIFSAKGGEITFQAGGDITVFGGPDIKINS